MAAGRKPSFLITWPSASSSLFSFTKWQLVSPRVRTSLRIENKAVIKMSHTLTSHIFYWSHRMPCVYEFHTQRQEFQEQGIVENHLGDWHHSCNLNFFNAKQGWD